MKIHFMKQSEVYTKYVKRRGLTQLNEHQKPLPELFQVMVFDMPENRPPMGTPYGT